MNITRTLWYIAVDTVAIVAMVLAYVFIVRLLWLASSALWARVL